MDKKRYITNEKINGFSGVGANYANGTPNDSKDMLHIAYGDKIFWLGKVNSGTNEFPCGTIYGEEKCSVQEQKDFRTGDEELSQDHFKPSIPDTIISILYLSSNSYKRILEKIETGKIAGRTKKEWRRIRHKHFAEMVSYSPDSWYSSFKMLLKKSVVPFLGEAYKYLLKKGAGLALDFTEEDRAIQDLSDEFNDNKSKKPYKIKYGKFFGVRANELLKRIKEWAPRILHIAGHGTGMGLTFINAIRGCVVVTVEELAGFLNECENQPDLIFFATCDSCEIAHKVLEKTKVKAAVGMKGRVEDGEMALFTNWFYRGLMQGKRISDAIHLACQHSKITEKDVSVKYKNGADVPFVLLNDRKTYIRGVTAEIMASKQKHAYMKSSPLKEIKMDKMARKHMDKAYGNVGIISKLNG